MIKQQQQHQHKKREPPQGPVPRLLKFLLISFVFLVFNQCAFQKWSVSTSNVASVRESAMQHPVAKSSWSTTTSAATSRRNDNDAIITNNENDNKMNNDSKNDKEISEATHARTQPVLVPKVMDAPEVVVSSANGSDTHTPTQPLLVPKGTDAPVVVVSSANGNVSAPAVEPRIEPMPTTGVAPDAITTTLEGVQAEPDLLSEEGRAKQHLFVHVGKAGGSSIQVMVQKSREKCEELTSKGNTGINQVQVCALSTIPNGRVHLKERLHPKRYYSVHTQFLVNLRDPIDRLLSWYNYELASFRKEPRWRSANTTGGASDNFRRLTKKCYPPANATEDGFAKMVNGGLLLSSSSQQQPLDVTNEAVDETTRGQEPCDKLARLCLRGDIMCFGHNYYNYETYLEEILLRKGFSWDPTNNNNNTENKQQEPPETIRFDVIRSEYSMDDFNRTVGLWTSQTQDDWKSFSGVTPFVQSLYGRVRSIQAYDSKAKKPIAKQEVLGPEARSALCKHICHELVVYKLALKVADNLKLSEKRESYEALDEHCGFSVDAVCGITWTFRNVKGQKKIFRDAPW